jgi:hypothetical protein
MVGDIVKFKAREGFSSRGRVQFVFRQALAGALNQGSHSALHDADLPSAREKNGGIWNTLPENMGAFIGILS